MSCCQTAVPLLLLLLAASLPGCFAAKQPSGFFPGKPGVLPAGTSVKEAANLRHVCGQPRNWSAETEQYAAAHPSRVLTGYISAKGWAILEFIFMTFASWSAHTAGYPARFDIVAAGDESVVDMLRPLCTVVPEGVDPASLRNPDTLQQCFFFPYPDRSEEHYGHFGINQAAFMMDEKISAWLSTYDLVMKTDLDIFMMPGLLDFFPPPGKVVFGRQRFVLLPETETKVKAVAAGMGLPVRPDWQHNTGMSSYGTFAQVQAVARVMMAAIKYILEETFPQKPEGGPSVGIGDNWPEWCAYITPMYAQEVAANTALPSFVIDPRLDANSDLEQPTDSLLHIHCQHGAQRFNKREFFKHHYRDFDLETLNLLVSRDCVTYLAVGTWRAYLATSGREHPPEIEEKDEL